MKNILAIALVSILAYNISFGQEMNEFRFTHNDTTIKFKYASDCMKFDFLEVYDFDFEKLEKVDGEYAPKGKATLYTKNQNSERKENIVINISNGVLDGRYIKTILKEKWDKIKSEFYLKEEGQFINGHMYGKFFSVTYMDVQTCTHEVNYNKKGKYDGWILTKCNGLIYDKRFYENGEEIADYVNGNDLDCTVKLKSTYNDLRKGYDYTVTVKSDNKNVSENFTLLVIGADTKIESDQNNWSATDTYYSEWWKIENNMTNASNDQMMKHYLKDQRITLEYQNEVCDNLYFED